MDHKVLEGIRVIDMTQVMQGPQAGAMLGDLGADVIHVEQLGWGDQLRGISNIFGIPTGLAEGRHSSFEYFNRNKRGIALDLKNPASREILHTLVKNSDVFVTNYLPDRVMEMGLDYATLSQLNPKLVYGIASLYGPDGPESDVPGFDQNALARSGILMASGDASTQGPSWLPVGMADVLGGINLFIGILAALMARERFGFGQEVKTGTLGAMINLQAFNLITRLLSGAEFPRLPLQMLPVSNQFFQCQDGKYIQLSAQRDIDWLRLIGAVGLPELEHDPETDTYAKRTAGKVSSRIVKLFTDTFASRPCSEWQTILMEARVPHAVVNKISDLETDEMVIANKYIVDYDHPALGKVKFVGFPTSLSKTPMELRRCAPQVGEHTEEVLMEVGGYSWDDITRLRESGAI